MKAQIVSSEKQTLPRYSNVTNQDEPTVVVVTKVEFVDDKGKKVYTQTYAQLPEHVTPDYFQRQADAMQADLEHAKTQAKVDKQSKLADEKVESLTALIEKKNVKKTSRSRKS